MRTHVALLRGINVGGSGKLPMAELRRALGERGFTDVATYIQSGNVVLTSTDPDPDVVAGIVAATLRDEFDLSRPVVAFDRASYAAVVADDPFPQVTDPKLRLAVFRAAPPDEDELAGMEAAMAAERAKGGRGEYAVVGRVVHLYLPDGMGRSGLGARSASRTSAPDGGGTSRNWATVRKLLELLG